MPYARARRSTRVASARAGRLPADGGCAGSGHSRHRSVERVVGTADGSRESRSLLRTVGSATEAGSQRGLYVRAAQNARHQSGRRRAGSAGARVARQAAAEKRQPRGRAGRSRALTRAVRGRLLPAAGVLHAVLHHEGSARHRTPNRVDASGSTKPRCARSATGPGTTRW